MNSLTTTMRVRASTHRRLAREAELAGTKLVDVLDAAADLLEEQRMLESLDRSYRLHGQQLQAEVSAWEATLADGLDSA